VGYLREECRGCLILKTRYMSGDKQAQLQSKGSPNLPEHHHISHRNGSLGTYSSSPADSFPITNVTGEACCRSFRALLAVERKDRRETRGKGILSRELVKYHERLALAAEGTCVKILKCGEISTSARTSSLNVIEATFLMLDYSTVFRSNSSDFVGYLFLLHTLMAIIDITRLQSHI
jgi:hypothetical protein